jgi:BMFP domain-containing protein YqiC
MFNPQKCEDLAKKLFAALPGSLQNIEQDIQQKFKEILQLTFEEFNLVTRDEFDVQKKVLERTREKLDNLQQVVLELQKDA